MKILRDGQLSIIRHIILVSQLINDGFDKCHSGGLLKLLVSKTL